jgi:hypothetical protein
MSFVVGFALGALSVAALWLYRWIRSQSWFS